MLLPCACEKSGKLGSTPGSARLSCPPFQFKAVVYWVIPSPAFSGLDFCGPWNGRCSSLAGIYHEPVSAPLTASPLDAEP